MSYRTYDRQWNRTGYTDEPRYSGQAALNRDYSALCHCGKTMAGCGDADWLRLRVADGITPPIAAPPWVGSASGYVAWCANGHELVLEEIASHG